MGEIDTSGNNTKMAYKGPLGVGLILCVSLLQRDFACCSKSRLLHPPLVGNNVSNAEMDTMG